MKYLWLGIYFIVLIWSAINPKDTFTWFLEVLPALIGLIILAFTYKKFTFSTFTYILILIHCIILMVGGHYTYAQVPLFDTIAEIFGHARNNYDKVGHFAQGFIPSAIARELMIRQNIVFSENWRNFFVITVCLALSAFYELIEWWVALASGENADSFLGTQGYIWDTQSDMMWALIGSLVFLIFFRKIQDYYISKVEKFNIRSCFDIQ